MSDLVMLVVLGAALLHATWNAMLKAGQDKQRSMVALVLGSVLPAVIVIPFVPAPAIESWPWIASGIALHVGYQLFLVGAYQLGDLSQVYPIARGSAPLFVTLVSVLFLGVALSELELLAIVLIAAGVVSICLVREQSGSLNRNAAWFALATGGFIASYSLVDGIGARIAGTALGYYGWHTIGNAIVMLFVAQRLRAGLLADVMRSGKMVFLIGGGASFIAYSMVIWAFTQAPIVLVTALRETSIVFALLIGVLHLKERLSLMKVLSTMTTLVGAALLRFAR